MPAFAPMAPFAPPAATTSPPIKNPVAPPTQYPQSPFAQPAGPSTAAAPPEPIEDDSYAPLAPLATPLPGIGGGAAREPEAAGPQYAVQYNEFGHFTGTQRFLYNDNNQAILLDGNLYFTSSSGGSLSAINGILNITASSTVTILSQNGGMNFQVTGANIINMSTAATGFVAIQGVLFRTSGVGVTFTNYPLTLQASQFRVQNSSGSVAFFTVNPNFGTGSPINMQALPGIPTGLSVGDIWNDGGHLAVWAGLETASAPPKNRRRLSSGFITFLTSFTSNVSHWTTRVFFRVRETYDFKSEDQFEAPGKRRKTWRDFRSRRA